MGGGLSEIRNCLTILSNVREEVAPERIQWIERQGAARLFAALHFA